jgi:hypothetical protein
VFVGVEPQCVGWATAEQFDAALVWAANPLSDADLTTAALVSSLFDEE